MRRHPLLSLATGAVAGLWAGLLGVGGGILIVPMLTGFFHLPRYRAHATSLAIMAPLALAAALFYSFSGYHDWLLAVELAGASTVGVVVGAGIMERIPPLYLRKGFGVVVLVAAVRMAIG